jgi:uncharacterized protein YbcC (UPF0753/DUF2309 family)
MARLVQSSVARRRLFDAAVDRACAGIAPAWPLDRAIAVNPGHGATERRFEAVAADLAATNGVRWLPPRATLRQLWRTGELRREHVLEALAEEQALEPAAAQARADDLLTALQEEPPALARLPLLADFADACRRDAAAAPWSARVLEQIARFAASWFDRGQAAWSPDRRPGLYNGWRARLRLERRPPTRMGRKTLRAWLDRLPDDPRLAIAHLLEQIGLDAATLERVDYLGALLGSVRGWASWCAHERWQARLRGGDDDSLVELLAVRLAWEALLVYDLGMQDLLPRFHRQLQAHPDRQCDAFEAQRDDRLLLRAAELAFQGDLAGKFAAAAARRPRTAPTTAAAAVFCIDVRSERMRRALERASGGAVATHGFAGFFGLPIAHTPLGAVEARPQLPGLFAPTLESGEEGEDPVRTAEAAAARQLRLSWRRRWSSFRSGPGSAFTFVETFGLMSLGTLAAEAFGAPKPARSEHVGLTADERAKLQPCWLGAAAQSVERRTDLAAAALRGMGLLRNLPRLVLLVGHGSSNRNNAHAAALDCGACGGHSGRDNAQLLARTLMEPEVRAALARRGIDIPPTTRFVAALHDTTTDEVDFAAAADEPAGDPELAKLRGWLQQAGEAVRAERAPGLGLHALAPRADALLAALRARASDWAQVRPEWGLAGNAALVFAPRSRTQAIDLGGRAFLHDYRAEDDEPDGELLAQLFQAPMQVAAWINLQYYASVVDPRAFGSGNKLLHDVVGGRLGVCEGNGGDLRFGLPLQSVHDGRRWLHAPLRLSVYVEADEPRIESALAAADDAKRMVENGWLHLLRIDADGSVWQRLRSGSWRRQQAAQPAGGRERPIERPAPQPQAEATSRIGGMLLAMLALCAAILLRAYYLA